jgi:hypothetical protein
MRVTRSRIERSTVLGAAAVDAHLALDGVSIEDTRPASDGDVGDGVLVWSNRAEGTATIRSTLVDKSARAGISSFAGAIDLRDSVILCSRIAIDGEMVEKNGLRTHSWVHGRRRGAPKRTR